MSGAPAALALDTRLVIGLLALARAAHGREICGFIGAGPGGQRGHPVANTACADDRFAMDAAEHIRAFKTLRVRREHLLAIYHSHPTGEAVPSHYDLAGHGYPAVSALIIAPAAIHGPRLRAWSLTEATARELTVTTTLAFL